MASRFDLATGNIPLEFDKPSEPKKKVISFGFNSDVGNKPEFVTKRALFRAQVGEQPRIAIIGEPNQLFIAARVHWVNGPNRYVLCKAPEIPLCCERFGQPRWRIGSVIFRYDDVVDITTPRGMVMPWLFSERVYTQLRTVNSNYPLTGHDLIVRCENDRFQTASFTPCTESHFNRSDAMAALYIEDINACRRHLEANIGADLSEDQMRALHQATNSVITSGFRGGLDQATSSQLDQLLSDVPENPPTPVQSSPSRYDIAQIQADPEDNFFSELMGGDE